MPLYKFLQNLLNVLLQIANKVGLQGKKMYSFYSSCNLGWSLPPNSNQSLNRSVLVASAIGTQNWHEDENSSEKIAENRTLIYKGRRQKIEFHGIMNVSVGDCASILTQGNGLRVPMTKIQRIAWNFEGVQRKVFIKALPNYTILDIPQLYRPPSPITGDSFTFLCAHKYV
jgi:hypothetical protein